MPFPYPKIIIGTQECRVLTVGNINSDPTEFDIISCPVSESRSPTFNTFGHFDRSTINFYQQVFQQIPKNYFYSLQSKVLLLNPALAMTRNPRPCYKNLRSKAVFHLA